MVLLGKFLVVWNKLHMRFSIGEKGAGESSTCWDTLLFVLAREFVF